jgi:hypothetical protein
MAEPLAQKLTAGLIGIATIGALAIAGAVVGPAIFQATMASEPRAAQMLGVIPKGKALDTNLVRFNGDYYAIGTAPGVSLEPTSQVQVMKIGYGQTSFVNIMTTSSGIYSSEALASPYFRYPGIYKQRLHVVASPFSGSVLGWSRLSGWVKIPLLDAGSIAYLSDYMTPHGADGVCVRSSDAGHCR